MLTRRLLASILLVVVFMASAAEGFELPGLSRDATAYFNDSIRSRAPAQPNPTAAREAVARARTAATAGQWSQAVQAYEQAIGLGDRSAATLLALSEAWGSGAQPNYQRALQVAWLAFQEAPGPVAEAPALVRMGELLQQRLNQPARALEAFEEALQRSDAIPGLGERIAALRREIGLTLKNIRVDTESDPPRACLEFSSDLSGRRDVRFEDFIRLEPSPSIAVERRGSSLCIAGLDYGQAYRLSLLEGLPGAEGLTLKRPEAQTVRVGHRVPRVAFRTDSFILPKSQIEGIPLVTVNVGEVALKLYRIADRNLVHQINRRGISSLLDSYDAETVRDESGRQIWEGSMPVQINRNRPVTTVFPLGQVVGQIAPGIYVLTAQASDRPSGVDSGARSTQWLVITDIGLITLQGVDGLTVMARSLSTALPAAGVELSLVARNNEELGRISTDAEGKAQFPAGLLRGSGGAQPVAVMAYAAADDFTFIDLTDTAFDFSDRGVEGRKAPGPLDAFLYTDRGIYRPGETVHLGALLRDDAANAVENVPVTIKVRRPNGTLFHSSVPRAAGAGGSFASIVLTAGAPLGAWTVEAFADPKAPPIGRVDFQVEDFVPERLKVEISGAPAVLTPGRPAELTVASRFLYGPPAAGLDGEAELTLSTDDRPFPMHRGYRFGLAQESFAAQATKLTIPTTGPDGRTRVTVRLNAVPDTSLPLKATVAVAIAEPGGRPTRQRAVMPVAVRPVSIGIRPRFERGGVDDGQEAGFDLIAVDPEGKRIAASNLRLELIRERPTYQFFVREGRTRFEVTIKEESVLAETVAIGAEAPASFARVMQFGRYRLEVFDPQSGAATSVRFRAGWQVASPNARTPDTVDVTADKARYRAGENARLRIVPPFAGEVLLTVATDRVWSTRSLSVPADGVTVEVPTDAQWGAGAYVMATLVRPRVANLGAAPIRAIGLAWLALDPAQRSLAVEMTAPDVVRPRQTVEVALRLRNADNGAAASDAFVTLAAVDEGILQLTDFVTPDPAAHYFGKRRLGLDVRDHYGRLIDPASGPLGQIRQGGDEGGGGRGLPVVPIRILALFSGAVKLDANGVARIPLQLPDFNGEVRLMVVAFDRARVGRGEGKLVVRDPVVAELGLPRFLAPGDEARATLSVHNVDGNAGTLRAVVEADGAAAIGEGATQSFDLARGARAQAAITLRGASAGIGRIKLTVTGPGDFQVAREWAITVRPSRTAETTFTTRMLGPNESATASLTQLASYVPGTAGLQMSFANNPRYDVPGLMRALERWAYGCLEQVTSMAMPMLFVRDDGLALGADPSPGVTRGARIDAAISRILDKQRYDGAFGLWSARAEAEPWLTAYAVEFLARARAAGNAVPAQPFEEALRFLREEVVNRRGTEPSELAARAYALYSLDLAGAGRLGILRYFADTFVERLPTPLAKAQIGAALARHGDEARAVAAFRSALGALARDPWSVDYGSTIRDAAAIIVLMTEAKLLPERLADLLDRLPARDIDARQTSTQEQAWLVMAAEAIARPGSTVMLELNNRRLTPADPIVLTPTLADLSRGLVVRNAATAAVWQATTVFGVPTQPSPATRNGLRITRRFFNRDGSTLNLDTIKQNDVFIIVLEGEAQTKLAHQAIVVHPLPAGWEIENANLGTGTTGSLGWLDDVTRLLFVEARDDRYVAAVNLTAEEAKFRLAYMVRAVTPGQFELPGAALDDMYKPRFFARQGVGRITVAPAN